MAKFHITDDGPKPCIASVRECKYGGAAEHYNNAYEAFKEYDKRLVQENNTFSDFSKQVTGEEKGKAKKLVGGVIDSEALAKSIATKQLMKDLEKDYRDLEYFREKLDNVARDYAGDPDEYGEYNYRSGGIEDTMITSAQQSYNASIESLEDEVAFKEQVLEGISKGYKKPVLTSTEKAEVDSYVDRQDDSFASYYDATDKKHFQDPLAPGSKFTSPKLEKVEDVLSLAMRQRGSLEGDDKDKFIAQGSSPDAFRDGNRYIMIKTPGKLGVKKISEMNDDDLLEVTRTKPGTPCNIVRPVDAATASKNTTDTAVAVLTTNRDTGKEMLITTFPGIVTKNIKNDELDTYEGKKITVREAKKMLGDDAYVNLRVE